MSHLTEALTDFSAESKNDTKVAARTHTRQATLSTFWKNTLFNYPTLTLPEKDASLAPKPKKFNHIPFSLDASLSQSMYEFSRQYNSNLFCFFYLGLIETLSKLTQQSDIAITTLLHGQTNEVSPLLLRYKLNQKLSFCEQFTQASLSVLQAYEHKDSNLESLLTQLNLKSPELFQIMMSVTDGHSRNMIYLPCKECTTIPFPNHHPKAEISFSLQHTEEGIQGELCYNESRYEAKFIETLLASFKENLQENLQYFNK